MSRAERLNAAIIQAVGCTTCERERGRPCRGKDGEDKRWPHPARRDLAMRLTAVR